MIFGCPTEIGVNNEEVILLLLEKKHTHYTPTTYYT